jgi:hypothetical protein
MGVASAAAKAKAPHPDPKVRQARTEGHEVFDMLWQEGPWSRNKAYAWLARKMGYTFHFGEAEADGCRRAQALCMEKLEEMGLI